tara:strand:+ start:15330 stop:15947 length:618 start_codon:yes stop_codon:yes gene_type:complete
MIYFTADTHFNHKNIIKYCNRTAFGEDSSFRNGTERLFNDVHEMNEHMIDSWNSVVKHSDVVYHLGDVFFGPKDEAITLCNRLNGYKILLRGNHDLKPPNEFWLQAGFSLVYTLGHRKTHRIEVEGQVLHLSHYPYVKDLTAYDERTYLHHHAPEEDKTPLLHGHVHDRWQTKGHMINVGVDVWDYKPVSIGAIQILVKLAKGKP